MIIARRGVLVGAACLAAAPRADAATPRRGGGTAASAVLRDLKARLPIPALSGAMARPRSQWAEAAGMADLELGVRAQPHHRFRLGSCSKVVTAAAAMRLVEQGRLDLDAPISTYLPDLPAQHRQTTTRQLLGHQGGIRHYNIVKDFNPSQPGGHIDTRTYRNTTEMLAIFINDPLLSPPGEAMNYSSFGFTLIGAVMEKAAGAAFPEIVQREVSQPLRLTIEAEAPGKLMPNRVRPYELANNPGREGPGPKDPVVNAPPVNPSYKWPGGGLIGSAPDLSLFGLALLTPGYLQASSLEALFRPQPPRKGPTRPPLGLAWRIDSDAKGRRRYHHAGAIQGGRAQVVIYPDAGLAIGLCSNLGETPLDPLAPAGAIAEAFGV
jgi:serine beta-lactamase-like protein LACTB, mitochondrial